MTNAQQPAQPRPSMWIVDYSDLDPPPGAALLLTCKSCRRQFRSDYEEARCGDCVARRELPIAP